MLSPHSAQAALLCTSSSAMKSANDDKIKINIKYKWGLFMEQHVSLNNALHSRVGISTGFLDEKMFFYLI